VEPGADVKNAVRVAAIVAAAIGASLFMYAGGVEAVLSQGGIPGLPLSFPGMELFRYVIFGLSLATAAATLLLPRFMLRGNPEDSPSARLDRLKTATFISLVMAEAPSLYGLVLFLVGGWRTDFYALTILSLFLVAMRFPRLGAWEEYLRSTF
jgi:protein-S-isoprenylcysteine O-methyltransferase Ste14